MIDKIIAFSIKNKLIVLLSVIALIVWGLFSLTQIPIGSVPDITNNQVQVITTSRNLATEDIEQFITYPVELEMANLPGVQEIRSISKFGLSVVTIIFDDDMGTYLPRQLIAEKIKSAQEQIPEGFGTPEMGPITTGLGEIYQYVIDVEPGYEDQYTTMDLRTIQDWIIKRQLSGIPGVVEVNTWGGFLKQYEVMVNPDRLQTLNISIGEVFAALQSNNENAGGGYIEKRHESYFVRGEGMVTSIEDIENTVVKNRDGIPIYMRDVGQVHMGYATRFGAITGNGQGEKVLGQVMMIKGGNSLKVINAVKDRVAEVQNTLPKGVVINPFLERSELIDKTTYTIGENLILGALIVVFIVVLILGDIRSGLIVASIIPLSLLFSLGMMNVFGVSANLMSMGAIDFGIIIDGAVIIVEYVLHQFKKQGKLLTSLTGTAYKDQKDAIAQQSASRMMHSAFFGQIIILIVFVPILSLSGIEGKMFKPMAMVFSFAIIGSIILCLTYIPAVTSVVLKPQKHNKKNISDWLIGQLEKMYVPSLAFAIRNKMFTIIAALILLTSGVVLYLRMGGEFVPTLDEGDFVVQPILKPGTSLSETIDFTTRIENILLDNFPEVSQVVSRIGAAEVPTDPMSMEMSDIIVRLKPKSEWVTASTKDELAEKMKEAMSVIPGVEYELTQPIEMRFNELITGVRADVAIKIYGEDLDILYSKAMDIKENISHIQGASDISVEQITGLPQMSVKYNRNALAQYGLNVVELNRVIRMAFSGEIAGTVFEGERRFDLAVRFEKEHRQSIDDLKNLMINLENGSKVPISQLADIRIDYGPAQISRDNTRRRIVIGINVRNRDIESMVKEIQEIIKTNITLPEGYYISYGGQFENLENARQRLKMAVPVSLLLIFLMLYFTFKSTLQALIVYTAIPLASIGGVYLLWIRQMPFSISAGVGFIALFGIATLNGIVMISQFNTLEKKGVQNIVRRVISGAKSRLRPVLLTAAAAALGFLPMALSNSAGAEVQRPLATVVIGGLITATLLTLIVLPVVYLAMHVYINKLKRAGKRPILTAILILISASFSLSQQNKISLDEAQIKVREANPYIKEAEMQVASAKSMIKTGWSLGETSVQYTNGQINSELLDHSWHINQDFGPIFHQPAVRKMYQQQMAKAEMELARTRRNLEQRTEANYYELVWLQQKMQLIDEVYQLYKEANRVAKLKVETGESNNLAGLVIEMQMEELRLLLLEEQNNFIASQQKFKELLQTETMYVPVDEQLQTLRYTSFDSTTLATSLEARYFRKDIDLARQYLKSEKASLSPSFNAGYFNQTIDKVEGFNGWSVGVSIPLWYRPNAARIKSAQISLHQTEVATDRRMLSLYNQLKITGDKINMLRQKLSYYEGTALQSAEAIMHTAGLLYTNGEIEYLEYSRSVNDAIDIKLSYLDNLNNYNQAVIEYKYLLKADEE